MDNKLRAILKKNYYEPTSKETEVFIQNFNQYRVKKQQERKINFLALLLLALAAVCGLSIVLKETNNNLDIKTSAGEINK